ncbi:nuclear transport factor 2 family protein [Rhodocytophaga rosea]|uniref:Nuclear transport factor 2 family protein n=1 Tax=Rhodocytophaga rosea TaxID=2704465 RepID=A0A6C0GHV4_9BACT|nr:nuclear transport factor 2 family protein [Rhodocytophaga rosea]QHT67283.1 nuclear transport factor 2 family protein [Rhodocytophaga rosea]
MKSSIYSLTAVLLLFGSCSGNSSGQINQEQTKQVAEHHWKAFKENNLEEVMADYTDSSILITPDSTYRGLEAIRGNFIAAFKAFPNDQNPLTLNKTVVERDVAYILWQANTSAFELLFATDTFIRECFEILFGFSFEQSINKG